MRRQTMLTLLPGLVLGLWFFLAGQGEANHAGTIIPADFELRLSAPGVAVYERGGTEEMSEYVQVIDLSQGARIDFLYGAIVDLGRGEGLYGGNSPSIRRLYLETAWAAAAIRWPQMVCLTNGTYFRDTVSGLRVDPTELAFPVKRDGMVVSEGYEGRKLRRYRQMLALWSQEATIEPFSRAAFYDSTAPDIIVGVNEQAPVRSGEALPRTMLGVADGDGDGRSEILLLYSATAATKAQAVSTLRAFGARALVMLDGGGSTQLMCAGEGYIVQSRPLPQMVAVMAAGELPVAGARAGWGFTAERGYQLPLDPK